MTSPAHAESFSLPSYCACIHMLTERPMTFASFLVRNEKQGMIKPKIISYILFKLIRYTVEEVALEHIHYHIEN